MKRCSRFTWGRRYISPPLVGGGEIGQSPKMVKGEVYGVVARGFDRNEGQRKLPQDYSF